MAKKSLEELVLRGIQEEEADMGGKEGSSTVKYLVKCTIKTDGVVERPDVVGAIFGQTEGLLSDNLDLRELQKNGLIGRINVEIKSKDGKSRGSISIPSSLDKVKTAIIGASLETINRVGPCEAEIKVDKIQDVRDAKRKFIVDRTKELLKTIERVAPEEKETPKPTRRRKESKKIKKYKGQPAGPSARESDAIIIVEGRSDVINLLRCGIKNTIAIEGTNVPKAISELSKKKTTTAFLDGDRGGDLILKELLQVAELDYVARAPPGTNVEDLSKKEVRKALKEKVPANKAPTDYSQHKKKKEEEKGKEENYLQKLTPIVSKLRGTLKAKLFDKNMEEIEETRVRELSEKLKKADGVKAVVFDGVVTQKLADIAKEKGLEYLIGMRKRLKNEPRRVKILTPEKLE